MSAWEPTDKDVQWLVNLLDMLKVGGIWVWPSYGVIVHKTDENTLSLQPSLIPTPEATEMIRRTKKVAEKAGIYIDEPETVNPAFKRPGFLTVSSPAREDDCFMRIWHEAQEKTPPSIKVKTYESEKYIAEINEAVTEGQMKQAELYFDMCPEGNVYKIVDTKGNVLATLRRK